jgi:hypothetical protein
MATKDISDLTVCVVVATCRPGDTVPAALQAETGEPLKVCFAAMARAERHGWIDFGDSANFPWLTDAGRELVRDLARVELHRDSTLSISA